MMEFTETTQTKTTQTEAQMSVDKIQEDQGFVHIKTSDDQIIIVPVDVAKMSCTIKDLLDDVKELKEQMDEDEDEDEESVDMDVDMPISLEIDVRMLSQIIEYCKYHKDDPEPEEEEEELPDWCYGSNKKKKDKKEKTICEWDQKFFKRSVPELKAMMMAANYLAIKPMLTTIARTFAKMLEGKSIEQMRKIMEIKHDWTDAELADIKKKNEWFEKIN